MWRTTKGQRFQNYRATFSVLDVPVVSRHWIDQIVAGDALGLACPGPFREWVTTGRYRPLEAPRTVNYRTPAEQAATSPRDAVLVSEIYSYFKSDPVAFEACAIELWKMLARESVSTIATRASRDGGRDAYGIYSMGPLGDRIHLDFALEAKCYAPGNGCGVKETSRLISRLRHRQFGVFVTTSYVGRDPYREIRDDGHPVVIISARDIAEILTAHDLSTPMAVRSWLVANFPHARTPDLSKVEPSDGHRSGEMWEPGSLEHQ